MTKIAAIVSIYESSEWIEQRLLNLLEATKNSDSKIICINANSPHQLDHDIPYSMVSDKLDYIKTNERIGIYDAWNLAIKHCKSKYYTNANTDDLVSPLAYDNLSSLLDHDDDIIVTYCSWYTISSDVKKWSDVNQHNAVDHPGDFIGDFNSAQVGHFPMWRGSLHDKIGYFNGKFTALGDAEFWMRAYYKTCYKRDSRFQWTSTPLAAYRWRDGENAWNRFISPEQWQDFHKIAEQYKNESHNRD